ncbi:MAG: DUF367 family protein [Candidatus Nezhaarchaeota archaeon]|nr:DUF367 family protein [Candidatus Nezhaarchaeota archaeon]
MREPRLYVLRRVGCDPSKCTGLKLARKGLVELVVKAGEAPRGAIVLNPLASRILTQLDRKLAEARGVLAVDGSWEDVDKLFSARLRGAHRRLPALIASNPINYGVLHKLSTLEALAAALFILGFPEACRKLLSLYKWGRVFIELNYELLKAYSEAKSEEEARRVEEGLEKGLHVPR